VQRRLVFGPLLRRADRQKPALALDHDAARIERGRRDERDAAGAFRDDLRPDKFGAGARLAKAAAGEEQPDAPIPFRRDLPAMTRLKLP
jgi:hypothetical protein